MSIWRVNGRLAGPDGRRTTVFVNATDADSAFAAAAVKEPKIITMYFAHEINPISGERVGEVFETPAYRGLLSS